MPNGQPGEYDNAGHMYKHEAEAIAKRVAERAMDARLPSMEEIEKRTLQISIDEMRFDLSRDLLLAMIRADVGPFTATAGDQFPEAAHAVALAESLMKANGIEFIRLTKSKANK